MFIVKLVISEIIIDFFFEFYLLFLRFIKFVLFKREIGDFGEKFFFGWCGRWVVCNVCKFCIGFLNKFLLI